MPEEQNHDTEDHQGVPTEIDYHYIKNPGYRTAHVDSVRGTITPSGKLLLSFFTERNPIPLKTTNKIGENGQIAEEIDCVTKTGIIREVESSTIFDLAVAEGMARLILDLVEQVKKRSEAEAKPKE